MKLSWQSKGMRAVSHALAFGAAALVLFITLTPSHANDAGVLPLPVPDDVATVRLQPALGATAVPLAPGQQHLTSALLSNYIKRQEALRAVDVDASGPHPRIDTDMLMGYIARGSLGGGNTALSAIDSFTAPSPAPALPSVTSDMLASYVEDGYVPTAQRVKHANSERECLAQAIYHEARGESARGQLAVANIIVNRARSSRFPGSLCGVVYQNADKGRYKCQFTFACDGRSDAPQERGAWNRSVALASKVYAEFATGEKIGAIPDSALYYHTTNVRPSWSRTYSEVAEVGAHIFYAPN